MSVRFVEGCGVASYLVALQLRDNWIGSLATYHKLSHEKRTELGLPVALVAELDALETSAREETCFVQVKAVSMAFSLGGRIRHELRYTDTVGELLKRLDASSLVAVDGERLADATELALAVVPGVRIMKKDGATSYTVRFDGHPVAAISWLDSMGCSQYAGLFTSHGLEDFFAMPFLTAQTLDSIGVTNERHRRALLVGAKELQRCTPVQFVGKWLACLGCDEATIASFATRKIDLQSIRELHMDKLMCGLDESLPSVVLLTESIEAYKNFSSVEETFHWLRRHGFEKYAFHFARYNIPFYALPCVNFFIIDEMGVTHDDQLLLQALQSLKHQNFDVRAVAFWLRDLELERYNVYFASAGLVTLDAITKLTDAESEKLVGVPGDWQKLKTGLLEMQEFQFYYLATASLLQELGMERYSQLFALHGISIDVLPFLTEKQLVEMGISNKVDRKNILAAIEKIKHEIPLNSGVWGGHQQGGEPEQQRRGVGMRKGLGGSKASSTPSPIGSSVSSNSTDERSLEELLQFISGTDAGASLSTPPSSGKRKNRKKRNKNKSAIALSQTVLRKELTDPTSPPPSVSAAAVSAALRPASSSSPEEDDEELNEELDPELKRQVDGEVEEFRRRLEAAGQSSKTKLAPIFYLDSNTTKKH